MSTPNRTREIIQNRLAELGWNQSQLARRAGISQALVSKFMRGERNISSRLLAVIAAALIDKSVFVPPDSRNIEDHFTWLERIS